MQGFDFLLGGSQFCMELIEIGYRLLELGVKQKLAPCFLAE